MRQHQRYGFVECDFAMISAVREPEPVRWSLFTLLRALFLDGVILEPSFFSFGDIESYTDTRANCTTSLGQSCVGYGDRWSGLTCAVRPVLKRALDIIGALLALVAATPVMLVIAAAIAFDRGPIFHGHVRVGQRYRRFACYKFRTMVVDAEQRLAVLLETDDEARAEWERFRKLTRDPRITPFGRLLRKTLLDELPQLAQVLAGTMSLVGPRPVTQGELRQYYGRHARDYVKVRPGLTGLWQISGRSNADYARRVELDIEYIRDPSLRTDIVILAKTIIVVLLCRGSR